MDYRNIFFPYKPVIDNDRGIDLDIRIAEELMGLDVVGKCWATTDWEGGWILELEAAFKFDREVAVYVETCQCDFIRGMETYDPSWDELICGHFKQCLRIVPSYSTRDSDALLVWNKLRESGKWCCLDIGSDHDICYTIKLTPFNLQREHTPTVIIDVGDNSLAYNICLAALESLKPDKGVLASYVEPTKE